MIYVIRKKTMFKSTKIELKIKKRLFFKNQKNIKIYPVRNIE
jgi:hypothetical protein